LGARRGLYATLKFNPVLLNSFLINPMAVSNVCCRNWNLDIAPEPINFPNPRRTFSLGLKTHKRLILFAPTQPNAIKYLKK
jgi:hypothetical protein